MTEEYLFAYGTLRPSTTATHVLHGFDIFDYGKYPYVVRGDHVVMGNLCSVSPEEWKKLDRYEGIHKGLYTREKATAVSLETGLKTPCYVYVATDTLHPKRIQSGDWYDREE